MASSSVFRKRERSHLPTSIYRKLLVLYAKWRFGFCDGKLIQLPARPNLCEFELCRHPQDAAIPSAEGDYFPTPIRSTVWWKVFEQADSPFFDVKFENFWKKKTCSPLGDGTISPEQIQSVFSDFYEPAQIALVFSLASPTFMIDTSTAPSAGFGLFTLSPIKAKSHVVKAMGVRCSNAQRKEFVAGNNEEERNLHFLKPNKSSTYFYLCPMSQFYFTNCAGLKQLVRRQVLTDPLEKRTQTVNFHGNFSQLKKGCFLYIKVSLAPFTEIFVDYNEEIQFDFARDPSHQTRQELGIKCQLQHPTC